MTDTQLECWGVFRCCHGRETVIQVYPTFGQAFLACDQLIQLFQVDNGDFAAYGVKDMRGESRRNVIGEPDYAPEIFKTEAPKFLEHKS